MNGNSAEGDSGLEFSSGEEWFPGNVRPGNPKNTSAPAKRRKKAPGYVLPVPEDTAISQDVSELEADLVFSAKDPSALGAGGGNCLVFDDESARLEPIGRNISIHELISLLSPRLDEDTRKAIFSYYGDWSEGKLGAPELFQSIQRSVPASLLEKQVVELMASKAEMFRVLKRGQLTRQNSGGSSRRRGSAQNNARRSSAHASGSATASEMPTTVSKRPAHGPRNARKSRSAAMRTTGAGMQGAVLTAANAPVEQTHLPVLNLEDPAGPIHEGKGDRATTSILSFRPVDVAEPTRCRQSTQHGLEAALDWAISLHNVLQELSNCVYKSVVDHTYQIL
ncbi:hypothetical protein FVE85_8066 [Porphyridium purpureum]|uniref:Uncharacterized protein n=1 Tax=Porphyridium purpureum TaxID=35688 RepID=A0A5J4YMA4_PORPP|nr:hypothetical protein FVE85_8066 [Porphyridium purpureum]|eukprot:POR6517..scf295_9